MNSYGNREQKKALYAWDEHIRYLKRKLALAHQETITVRNLWFQQFEDLGKEKRWF